MTAALVFGALCVAAFAFALYKELRGEGRLDIPGEDANYILNYGWDPE